MPFILGVLIAIGLSVTLVSVVLGNTFGDYPMFVALGQTLAIFGVAFFAMVVRKIGTSALLLVRMVRAPPQGALVKLKLSAVIGPM